VTPRGVGTLTTGLVLAVAGWLAAWPELTVLGAGAATLPVACLLAAGRRPSGTVTLTTPERTVRRGEMCQVDVSVQLRRSRGWLRVVDGGLVWPRATVPVTRRTSSSASFQVHAEKRGLHQLGPFTLLHGDPWSLVRRNCGESETGRLLVLPRTFPVRRGLLPALSHGDSEALSRRRGDEHFFALRDYVLGDEPRNVHWRSSARSGRLVVKQKVAAMSDGTLVVLDVDATAYISGQAFGRALDAERFEAAVEVAASLCDDQLAQGDRVLLVTTDNNGAVLRRPTTGQRAIGVALAQATCRPAADCRPDLLRAVVAQAGCSRLLVVSGSPGPKLIESVRQLATRTAVAMVCVANDGRGPTTGMPGITVPGAEGLA
jgi:uncharacterized protein (DUF58 family)